ncbi:MAG: SpoIIE family protein phosphatase [Actinomycetota bacterium]|nr:SpoIIE family protein phosphatase [Actinomycetota bacterium]
MLKELSEKISHEVDDLVEEMQGIFEENIPTYADLSSSAKKDVRNILEALARKTTDFMAEEGKNREEIYAFARKIGRNRSVQSIPFGDLVRVVFLVETIIWNSIMPEVLSWDITPEEWVGILELQSEINSNLISALSASYLETKDEIINRQLRELHGLLEVGRTIASTMDLDRVFLQILEVAAGIMRTPMGAVYLLEKSGGELRLVSQVGLDTPWVEGRRVDLDRSLLAQAVGKGSPVTGVDDLLTGLALPTPVRGGKVRSVLSCPIMKDEEAIGGLELYDVQPRTYNRLDMALLSAFAPQAGVAIENARLFDLERKARRQTAMMKEMAEEAASAMKFNHAVGIVVRKMAELAGVNKCFLFFYDAGEDELEFVWGHGLTQPMSKRMRELRWCPGDVDELTEAVVSEGKMVVVEDAAADPRVNNEHMRELKIRSCIYVPMLYKGEVRGLLLMGDSKKKISFTQEDLDMIEAVADQATLAIEQARLRKRVRQRERRLQELEASERVFHERERSEAIISANPEAIFLVDRERNITLFNPAANELFGWREDEAVGRRAHEVLYGDEKGKAGECPKEGCPIDAAFRGEKVALKEMEYVRGNGSKVWISGSFSVIRNKKRQIESVICVFRDITEQKRLQHLALVDKELDIASHIQGALLPQGSLENDMIGVMAHQEQARIVGGDWYDFWEEEDRLILVIGDATGSGVPAALLATLAMSYIRAESKYRSDIHEMMIKANRAIVPHRLEDRFITIFYGELDLKTLVLRYVNAGHNDPILIKGGTTLKTLGSKKRTVLGVFEKPDLKEEKVQMEPGDRLFMYTDGVTDCKDSKRNTFGEYRLKRYLKKAGSRKATAFIDDLVSTLSDFSNGKMEDDFTILLCDINKT